MKTACFFVLRRIIVLLVFISFGVSVVMAAEKPASSAFKDPYNGGIALADGGGEPGMAYMAFINAAYKKDYAQICKLMTEPVEMDQCLQQKEILNSYIMMFTQPKSHKVLGGFMKGDEATLNVAYTFASAPQSTGFVVMKQIKGKWVVSSFGGSGSATVSAEVSGQTDFGSSSASGPAAENSGPLFGKWAFTGKDDKGVAWTGTLTINKLDTENFDAGRFHSIFSFQLESANSGRGVEAPSKWDAGKQEASVNSGGISYTAILSPDRKSLTQGKWTESEKDFQTRKVTIISTGVWSAKFIGQ